MNKKLFIINGENFSDLDGFYDEIQKVLTKNFKGFGRNLDAFNDILSGGFGKFDEFEPITLMWKNFNKSKKDFDNKIINKLLEIIRANKNIEFKIEN